MKSSIDSATVLRKMHFTFHRLLVLFLVLMVLGAVLWVLLALLMAWGILRPPRMSAGKAIYHLRRLSPGDLGLGFEEQTFIVRDATNGQKLSIAGWWIPSASVSQKCVVLLHGYADAKVGAIAWAPLFHDLDCNVLAIDLRAHGDSGGRFCTGGFFERNDVTEVLDQLLNLYPDQTRQLILFGISLGAAVACAVAAGRDDIAAVILESPFADYERAIAAHTRLMGLPGGLLLQFSIACAQQISGARFNETSPAGLMKRIKCPIFAIVGADDELLDIADRRSLEQATMARGDSNFWLVEETGHIQAMETHPVEYEQKIRDFLLVSQRAIH